MLYPEPPAEQNEIEESGIMSNNMGESTMPHQNSVLRESGSHPPDVNPELPLSPMSYNHLNSTSP